MCAFALTLCAFGGERIDISVCDFASVLEDVLAGAEPCAQQIFASIDVGITWAPCHEERLAGERCAVPRITLRVRPDSPMRGWMGRAFVGERNSGVMADVYYDVIHQVAVWHGIVSTSDHSRPN